MGALIGLVVQLTMLTISLVVALLVWAVRLTIMLIAALMAAISSNGRR